MTDETKIGLLMGIGLIVVFAVLLSRPNSDRLPGPEMNTVLEDQLNNSPGLPEALADSREAVPEQVRESLPMSTEGFIPAGAEPIVSTESPDESPLPSVPEFEPLDDPFLALKDQFARLAQREPSDSGSVDVMLTSDRTVPEEAKPDPASGTGSEIIKVDDRSTDTPESDVKPDDKGRTRPKEIPSNKVEPKTYIVKKGETLYRIAQTQYDVPASKVDKVIALVVQANARTVKSKDFVVEGQKLILPPLPAGLVEPVHVAVAPKQDRELKAPGTLRKVEVVNVEEVTGIKVEKANSRSVPDAADKKTVRQGDAKFRWYVVKEKDTLSSIARENLGGSQHWREIQKLNKNIKPTKMRPGDRLRLPARVEDGGQREATRVAA